MHKSFALHQIFLKHQPLASTDELSVFRDPCVLDTSCDGFMACGLLYVTYSAGFGMSKSD